MYPALSRLGCFLAGCSTGGRARRGLRDVEEAQNHSDDDGRSVRATTAGWVSGSGRLLASTRQLMQYVVVLGYIGTALFVRTLQKGLKGYKRCRESRKMSLLPLTGASLSSLASGTAHPDSASKLLGAEADGVGAGAALVSVLEVVESDGSSLRAAPRTASRPRGRCSNRERESPPWRGEMLRLQGARRPASSASSRREEQRAKNLESAVASTELLLVVVPPLRLRVVDYTPRRGRST